MLKVHKKMNKSEVKLDQKFLFNRKIFNVKYFLLKDLPRGTPLFHMSRIRDVFSTFQNHADYFQKH